MGQSDLDGCALVDVKLGFAVAPGGGHGDGRQRAVARRQTGPGVHVAEDILDDALTEITEKIHDGGLAR